VVTGMGKVMVTGRQLHAVLELSVTNCSRHLTNKRERAHKQYLSGPVSAWPANIKRSNNFNQNK
jgi:hypothetical protein